MPSYRSAIHIDGVPSESNTYWRDSFKKIPRKEDGQMFFREFLSEPVRFVRNDFDLINNANFEAEILFFLEESKIMGINKGRLHQIAFCHEFPL